MLRAAEVTESFSPPQCPPGSPADAAVRLALGAGAWRLARATLAEGLLLATAGTLLGVFLAAFAVRRGRWT